LLESTGWLAAHRRQQVSLKQNPVHSHHNSLAGEAARGVPETLASRGWRSWSPGLFRRVPAVDDGPWPDET